MPDLQPFDDNDPRLQAQWVNYELSGVIHTLPWWERFFHKLNPDCACNPKMEYVGPLWHYVHQDYVWPRPEVTNG